MRCKLCETETKPIYGYDSNSPVVVYPVTTGSDGYVGPSSVVKLMFCPNCGMVFVDISKTRERNNEEGLVGDK